ncbi:hypothetical protein FAZ95_37215 [Trinickia violacea]|uniref:Uncharacterized protein n=1 Tax=Trinickia violacea TaxID=2571746 RepID=A0A4P8IYM4_9BURK|nr:hypothetical protein [Trinickia violacea]QCP54528.1 hypothetical protein FAZ95_37215 [Trinickia violacea]
MYQVEQFMKYAGEFFNKRVASASLAEAAEVRARPKQSGRHWISGKWRDSLGRILDLERDALRNLKLSPEAATSFTTFAERLRDIEAAKKALKDDRIEPGTALEVPQIKQNQILDAADRELNEALARVLWVQLNGIESPTQGS